MWKCHIQGGYIRPKRKQIYPSHRIQPPFFIERNSAMTALFPQRNEHGVFTHHIPAHSQMWTHFSSRCEPTGGSHQLKVNWSNSLLDVKDIHTSGHSSQKLNKLFLCCCRWFWKPWIRRHAFLSFNWSWTKKPCFSCKAEVIIGSYCSQVSPSEGERVWLTDFGLFIPSP